ncbi:cupin domain-containing protein [Actinoplanes regularis]|uniref:cupin domain-containing protein n=1 Tax=Actinoplanes regularis TaxID=52697 RepID=UPI0015C67D53|nr:cupin domain-containing protein [Actinoplanes regularis]
MSGYFKVVPEASVPSPAASADKFDGEVWQAEILTRQRPDGLRGHRFAYAPGGRSHWHVHTGEQALIVVSGRGLIQWEGLAEPMALKAGDWVHVEPGVPHWHGATDDSVFVHLAVTATGGTEWGEPARP